MIDIRDASLLDILPSSLQSDPNVVYAAQSIDKELRELTDEIDRLPLFSRMDDLSSEEADDLAWELNIDFYDPTLPLNRRRELVKNAMTWHMHKGTPFAVEEVVTAIFDDAVVKEWFDYGAAPYTFKIVTREILTPEKYNEIVKVVNTVKNVRSRLETIETIRDFNQGLEISADYKVYQYPIPITNTFLCGTWPSPSTLGREVKTTMELSRSGYTQSFSTYRVAGKVIAGTDIVPDTQNARYLGGFEVDQDQADVIKKYNVCGELICGNEVI